MMKPIQAKYKQTNKPTSKLQSLNQPILHIFDLNS